MEVKSLKLSSVHPSPMNPRKTFDEDAEKAAEVLGITITKRGKTMLAGFPHHALDTYLPKLVHAGLKVAVCEQLEAPKK